MLLENQLFRTAGSLIFYFFRSDILNFSKSLDDRTRWRSVLNSDDVSDYRILVDEKNKFSTNNCPMETIKRICIKLEICRIRQNYRLLFERKRLICKRLASWLPLDVFHGCNLAVRIKIFENSFLCKSSSYKKTLLVSK